jgi:peptidoglycan/LPS O-acetylase OafA/YrhL
MQGSVFILSITIALVSVLAMFVVYAGFYDVGVLLFGLVVFLVGSLGFLMFYAGVAEEEAQREPGEFARLTRKILERIGLKESSSEHDGGEKEEK